MDPFHERLARIGLEAIGDHGFCLAGGYAVQAHGFLDRQSDDVDLFGTMAAASRFADVIRDAASAYRAAGLKVDIAVEASTFARLRVSDPDSAETSKVELAVDWREFPPTRMAIGPVLHADDAVANKMGALYTRGEVRDYIDVDAVLVSGRYSAEELLQLAERHDAGFDRGMFAGALAAVDRLSDRAFEPYGMTADEATALRERIGDWAAAIRTEQDDA